MLGRSPLECRLGAINTLGVLRCTLNKIEWAKTRSKSLNPEPSCPSVLLNRHQPVLTDLEVMNNAAQQIARRSIGHIRSILFHLSPRDRLLGVVAAAVVIAWLLIYSSNHSQVPHDNMPASVENQVAAVEEIFQDAVAESTMVLASEALPESTEPAWQWVSVTVEQGQNMDRIFNSLNLSTRLLLDVIALGEPTQPLVSIRPGDVFHFAFDEMGAFQALKATYDESQWLWVEATDSGLSTRLEARQIEYRLVEAQATIQSSLFAAAKEAKLSDGMTMKLANVFGWDIDFALDIRAGDRFSLLYEEVWRDGEFLRDGPILVARFVNRGDVFEAIRFDAGDGPDYYSPDGRRMRKAFLRAPLNFSRVTSNFNPKRFHPITKKVRPHNGTDYGAAVGTPVWSAGDGVVIESAYNRVNGHYVFVQHGNEVITRYLHLSRRDVRRGDRVRQGETIGAVGSTGLATGAHLHYEFLVNGVHRDPRKVDLPTADPLPSEHRVAFDEHAEQLMTRLDRFDETKRALASTALGSCDEQGEAC